jgi:two-component sensor histidine kinase
MAVHELCTNAVKYGALSNDAGRVEVVWRIEDGRLRLTWRERGGPPVFPPTRRGFGSRLLEAGLAAELGGSVELAFEPEGLVCRIDAPLSAAEDVA